MPELILIGSVIVLGTFIVHFNDESFLDCWTLSDTTQAFKTMEQLKEVYPDYQNGEHGSLYNMA